MRGVSGTISCSMTLLASDVGVSVCVSVCS